MMANGAQEKSKEKAYINIVMEEYMMGDGKKTWCMAMGCISGKTAVNMLVDTNWIRKVDMVNISGTMVEFSRAFGKMEKEMDKVG